jgi:photosystem II stability/assembly factor-like uncharacterized protein
MKIRTVIIFSIPIVLLGFFLFLQKSNKKVELFSDELNERTQELKRNKFAPYEYFQMMRNYPEFNLDEKGFRQALIQLQSKQQFAKSGELNRSWTIEGPTNIGGCITCVAVHPTDTSIIYLGSVNGGIYKTTNAGATWKPVFDSTAYLSIGSITIDKSNPTIMYAGTGDPNLDFQAFTGNGIYKSMDAGETWTHKGLDSMGIVSKIVIHPTNNQIIYAATMGRPMTRGLNRGLYKSFDGGLTWTHILSLGNETGVMDVIIDKNNPSIIYATGMRRIRTNLESILYGNTTRIYKSIDGGSTWNEISNGLPSGAWCKVNIDMHPTNTNILFACIVDSMNLDFYGIYKTTNGGTSWTKLDTTGLPSSVFAGFGWYFAQIRVNPFNTNELFLQGVDLWHSINGGLNWTMATPPWYTSEVHADKHCMYFFNASQYLLATDGGLYKTPDAGQSWNFISNIPITQFYHVAVNYWNGNYYGGAQDNGTILGTSSAPNNWQTIFGGDGFKPSFSNKYFDLTYVEVQNGELYYNSGSSFQKASNGFDSSDVPNWDMPYFLSRYNDNVFAGTQYVYKATDCNNPYFNKISPNLTDGNIYGARFHNISTLCESFVNQNILYAGTSDANVWRSLDGGSIWTNITGNLPNRYVTCVTTSCKNANTVYVSHTGYKYGEYIPHIHKSIDNGTTWTDISGDMPSFAVNTILTFSFDENLLMAGTDGGVFCTKNGGINWTRIGNNMPVFPVFDLANDTIAKKVVAATYARSIMSYDFGLPITGLNNLTPQISALNLYPNPAENILQIQNLNSKNCSITIYNLKGEVMLDNIHTDKIDVTNLSVGVYLMSINSGGDKPIVKKFMKR